MSLLAAELVIILIVVMLGITWLGIGIQRRSLLRIAGGLLLLLLTAIVLQAFYKDMFYPLFD
jgi:hypothetical protein